jgi:acetolactate synthase-1/2/3 large subunit
MPKMTGSRYFAEAMRGYGVSHLFYVNSIAGQAMQEAEKIGITRVVTHGEKAAAYMADGYSRASHRPGVCLCQDIGTTNLAAGMRDAHMACSPIIAITGGQNDQPRYRHAYQNAEDFRAWDTVTKANYSVDSVERFPDLLRQAFRDATSGSPGPVHLELRGNAGQMLEREADFDVVFEAVRTISGIPPEAEPSAVQAAVKALARPRSRSSSPAAAPWPRAQERNYSSSPRCCRSRSQRACTRRRWCRTIIRSRSACREATRAGAPTRRSRRRTSCSSSAATPADR